MRKALVAAALPLMLVACGGGGSGGGSKAAFTTGAADAQTITVDMSDALKFSPTTIDAKVGTVTFNVDNTGVVPHNFQFGGGLGKTSTVNGKTTTTLTVIFDKAGTYSFQCTFHPGMTGKVVVS